jgi:hypothetical protein
MDGQTDMKTLIVALRNIAEVSKNEIKSRNFYSEKSQFLINRAMNGHERH